MRLGRWTRFLTTFGSGTTWRLMLGPVPLGSCSTIQLRIDGPDTMGARSTMVLARKADRVEKGSAMQAATGAMTAAYRRVDERLRAGGIVVLDGGIGSELQEVGYPEQVADRPKNYTWGSLAIREAPEKLVEVHRRYAATGADVLETHTFALNRVFAAIEDGRLDLPRDEWKRMALDSVRLVREGAARAGRGDYPSPSPAGRRTGRPRSKRKRATTSGPTCRSTSSGI